MFKRILFATGIVLAVVAACDKPKQPEKEDPKVTLSVFPTSHTFEASSPEPFIVSVSCSGDWTATSSDTWITVTPASGSGNVSVTLKAASNTGEARTGTVTFQDKGKTLTKTFSVKQEGYSKPVETALVANPDPFDGTKRSSTTYQLLIYSFADSDGDGIGDFKGIQNKLDYLDGMGATALWLSPAHPTSSYHAYDVNDYNTVNSLYGTETDFKNLIDAAHARNIKIYMDFVLNHSGLDNVWFQSVLADPQNSPYKDFYVLSTNPSADVNAGKIDNYAGATNPGMGEWHSITVGKTGYTGRLHFVLDSKARTITVTKTDAAADTPPSTSDWYIYCNNFKGMNKTGDGKYEITLDIDTDWGFLVCSKTDWSSGSKFGASSTAGALQFGTPFSLYSNADNNQVGNITFGGYTTNYFASFARSMPDLNYGKYTECEKSGAFKATVDAATTWVNLGVDGFRLDAVMWIYQNQTKANQRFLDQWYKAVNAAYRKIGHTEDIFMVGEAWMDHGNEKQYYQGLTSNFEFDYFANDDNCVLRQALVKGNAGGYVNKVSQFIADHKAIRTDAVTSFFLTNHDNDRAGEILGKNINKEKQAAAFLLTTPGKSFIYQGEELGYYGNKGGGDEYVRTPILWDKAGNQCAKKGVNNKVDNAMLTSSISVEAQEADANSLLNVYKTWSRLRNTYAAFTDGTMTAGPGNGGAVASWYITGTDGSKFLVIHHTGTSDKTIDLSDDTTRPVAVLGTATLADKAGSTKKTLRLGPSSSVVFKL